MANRVLKIKNMADGQFTARLNVWYWGALAVIGAAVLTAYLPAYFNGFVVWDDPAFILRNEAIRAFTWHNIKTMFTTFYEGNYAPLSILSWAVDYHFWGHNPIGYHLNNVLLHIANSILVFLLSLRIFRYTMEDRKRAFGWHFIVCAAVSAGWYGLHPLRVESVAWATERRDVLSGFFYLLTILLYFMAQERDRGERKSRYLWAAAGCMALSFLAKAWAMSLPAVMLALDFYPLRRIGTEKTGWFRPETRTVWREKMYFGLLALPFVIIAPIAQHSAQATATLEGYGVLKRLAQSAYGFMFYIRKTFLPDHFMALYEIPTPFVVWHKEFVLSALAVMAGSWFLIENRRKYPAVTAAWFSYAFVVSPVLGIVQAGSQLTADRYTYISCIPWSMLAGAWLLVMWQAAAERNSLARFYGWFAPAVLGVTLFLAAFTWRQCHAWYDTPSMWRHAVAVEPDSAMANFNYAVLLAQHGDTDASIPYYYRAVEINPKHVKASNNLASMLEKKGRIAEAEKYYRQALEYNPTVEGIYMNLARTMIAQGKKADALEIYKRSYGVKHNESVMAEIRKLMKETGSGSEEKYYQDMLSANPNDADARQSYAMYLNDKANAMQSSGGAARAAVDALRGEVIRQYAEVLKIKTTDANIYNNMANAQARAGRFKEALPYYQRAIEIQPGHSEAYINQAIIMSALKMCPQAQANLEAARVKAGASSVEMARGAAALRASGCPVR
ncbi:MAG: tetratricopeptide repeat protein [Elusimicrobiaceae bacterium]|nr:tetratricopeptide repeat protein [Elusimicrobiaceae bacterium]